MNAKKAAAMIAIKADSKSLDRDLAGAKKRLRGFGSDVKKVSGKLWGAGAGALSKLGSGLGIQAAAGITETVQSIRDFERNLVRFQIAAGKTDPEMAKLRESILGVSKETAVASSEVLAGMQTYVDLTGDVGGAEAAMRSFARIAQASGAQVSDVATATAALKESMKLDPGDIEAAFSGLIQQGKAGAVSLKDFAAELSSLAPQFAKFGGSGVKGIADLGAAFQVTRKGFGSASEAATGMTNLMTALSRNADKFQSAGVKIFDKDPKTGAKRFRSFLDIVDAIGKSRLAKDPTALTKAFGSVEAQQAYDMLHANRKELEAIYTAGLDAGAVQRDLTTYMSSSTGRLDVAINNVKVAIVEAFTPERIAKFAEAIESAANAAGKLFDLLGKTADFWSNGGSLENRNPFEAQNRSWLDPTGAMTGLTKSALGLEDVASSQNSSAYLDTVRGIEARKTRDERIQAAIKASNVSSDAAGGAGVRMAGRMYLDELKNPRAVADVMSKMQGDAMLRVLGDIASKLDNRPTVVKMDGSAVAKTVGNAPAANRGGG